MKNDVSNLSEIILQSLTHLDLKGNDLQVSRAMTIVSLGFNYFQKSEVISPEELHKRALSLYPEKDNAERDSL